MKFQLTLKHILLEKLFELFCIGNDFAKYSAKFRSLFIILFCTLWKFLKMIFVLLDKSDFLAHNFTKCFFH